MPKITLAEATQRDFAPDWQYEPEGGIHSRNGYGHIQHAVMVDDDGNIEFDRPILYECPGVIAWTFARCPERGILSVLVKERRDAAALADGKSSVYFWGPPRGNVDEGEIVEQSAVREVHEETGASKIINVTKLGSIITNETSVGTFTPVVAMEVAVSHFDAIQNQHGEHIASRALFTRDELLSMIARGSHDGALCNSLVFMGVFQKFCIHLDAGNLD